MTIFFFLLQVVTMLACSIVTVAEERTADSTDEFENLLQVEVAIATVSSDHHHST